MKHPFSEAFDRCVPMLAVAVSEGGEVSLADVRDAILTGRAQLWEGEGAAVVTHMFDDDDERRIHGWLSGGRLRGVVELLPGIEAFGRAWGCQAATLEGRRGWARVFGPLGYCGDDVLRKVLL